MPPMVTPKTTAAAMRGRFQLRTRARCVVPSVNSSGSPLMRPSPKSPGGGGSSGSRAPALSTWVFSGSAPPTPAFRSRVRSGPSPPTVRSCVRSGSPPPALRNRVRSGSPPPAVRSCVRSASPPAALRTRVRSASSAGRTVVASVSWAGAPPIPQVVVLGSTSVRIAAVAAGGTTEAATASDRKVSGTGYPSSVTGICRPFGIAWPATSRICSPVRRKKCWKSEPPHVASTLTTPAPTIVPYTPSPAASLAATTAATALPATWGRLRSSRFPLGFSCASWEVSGFSPISDPCLPFSTYFTR